MPVQQLDQSVVHAATTSDELPQIVERLGIRSLMVVPLVARRRVLGTMALISGGSERVFESADLEVAACPELAYSWPSQNCVP